MTDAVALWIGERLLTGSIQAAAVVVAVWLACRLIPRMPSAAQATLWWLAALKLVLLFTPIPTLNIPLLPASVERGSPVVDHTSTADAPGRARTVSTESQLERSPSLSSMDWIRAVVLFWVAALLVHIVRLVVAHRALRGITSRSAVWNDSATDDLARRVGLRHVPQLRVSDEIEAPQAIGLRTPIILMPRAAVSGFSDEERSMTLCHEMMHIRRRDLALGWVPACAERLFFFHPFARLAAREYLTAREAACDAAVVRALGVAPVDYGRLLMRLGVDAGMPALAAGGAPFSTSSLKRRLHMLEHHGSSEVSRRWRWAIASAAALVIVPIQLVAKTPVSSPALPASPLLTSSRPLTLQAQETIATQRTEGGIPGKVQGKVEGTVEGKIEGTVEGTIAGAIQGPLAGTVELTIAGTIEDLRRALEAVAALSQLKTTSSVEEAQARVEALQKTLEAMARQRDLQIAEQLDPNRTSREVQDSLRALEQELNARARRMEAEAAQQKERTADFLYNELQKALLQQQDVIGKQIEQLKVLNEQLAAQQKQLAEEVQKLQRSLGKR